LHLEVQNTGDGIAYCTSYIDLTNLDTGVQQRLKVIFTDFTKKKN
jgi:hypothetical protein